jgi:hypothetical protein
MKDESFGKKILIIDVGTDELFGKICPLLYRKPTQFHNIVTIMPCKAVSNWL